VGVAAVRALTAEGLESGSVALRRSGEGGGYRSEVFITSLESVAKKTRRLDERFIAPARNDVTPAFVEYALPLVGELPATGLLAGRRVQKKLQRE
jgi:6-phosphofructokinase 1